MAIWPFNRKQKSDDLPEEVKEYYESGRKQRTGMAWLLALATLVVTVVLALVLFFGGRWVYQKIFGNDEPAPAPTEQAPTDQAETDQAPVPEDDSDANEASLSSPEGSDSETPAATSSSPTDSADTSATPSTGDSTSEIPDTGPGAGGLQ